MRRPVAVSRQEHGSPRAWWSRLVAGGTFLALAPAAAGASAQDPLRPAVDPPPRPGSGSYAVAAGWQYGGFGPFARFFLGDGYRELWTTPVVAPVLDLRRHAGGLTPIRVGGGFQTQTIHLRGGDDGYYLFRSVDKAVRKGLPEDVRDAPAGHVVQDQTSALHPAGAWVVPPLLEAVGVSPERPELFIMPDDPVLGEHREAFAGVLGMLVRSPDEGESGTLSWEGSDEILGSEDLLERLEASPDDRVDSRNLLAARLVDLVVGDPDRNFDNVRWIGFRDGTGGTVWRPVPMDRDPAFLKADGLLAAVARKTFLPKYVDYGPDLGDVEGLWVSQPEVDRLLLSDLDRPTWDSVALAVEAALTDAVIDRAVASLPPAYAPLNADFLGGSLRSRRDGLREAAGEFYVHLAREVDVQATDSDDLAEVVRHADGALEVSLHADCAPRIVAGQTDGDGDIVCRRTYFERRFVPAETEEVRVHLRAGDDHAIVRGAGPGKVRVRVVGGEGDDVLEDRSGGPGGASHTHFYDHLGENRIVPAAGTHVDLGRWDRPVITDFLAEKDGDVDYRDFGSRSGWRVVADYGDLPGVVLGVRRRTTDYGFRRLPWARRLDLTGWVGTRGGFGGEAEVRKRLEGSDVVLRGLARATRDLTSYRFFGYGNDTPFLDSDIGLVATDRATLEAAVELPLGRSGSLSVGPVARWLSSDPHEDGPLAEERPLGAGRFGQVGFGGSLAVTTTNDDAFPRLGIALHSAATAFAPVWDVPEWFGRADAEVRGYLPMPAGGVLATRAGGALAWGRVPVHESAFIGGRRSLRGYRYQRFAGDRSLFGSAELRLPLGRLTLLTRGDVGALAFADAGRVWVDSDSPGGWHTGWGGGLWYSTMGVAGTVAWARGEQNRIYFYLGLPF